MELRKRRDARAIAAAREAAAAEKKAVSEDAQVARQAQEKLGIAAKMAIKTLRAKPKEQSVAPKPKLKPVRPVAPRPIIQTRTRTGRVVR